MRPTIYIAAALFVSAAGVGFAATKSVYQKGRQFSEEVVVLKKGDELTFVNNDTVPHNIFSLSKGNKFDLGSQRPGTETDVTFTSVGDVQVMCAIHPRMKMLVKVTD